MSTLETPESIELKVFPNPTADNINLTGNHKNKIVEIYKFQTLIKSVRSSDDQLTLPLDELYTGLYFVVVKTISHKIVAVKRITKV